MDYWWQSCSKSFLIDILIKPGGHFKFSPLEKITDIFVRDLVAKLFRNGPWNSILPSNLASRRVVMELGYMTILFLPFTISNFILYIKTVLLSADAEETGSSMTPDRKGKAVQLYSNSAFLLCIHIATTCSPDTPKAESMKKSKNAKGGNAVILYYAKINFIFIKQLHGMPMLRRQRVRQLLRGKVMQ